LQVRRDKAGRRRFTLFNNIKDHRVRPINGYQGLSLSVKFVGLRTFGSRIKMVLSDGGATASSAPLSRAFE
jgi:hypothetical protein